MPSQRTDALIAPRLSQKRIQDGLIARRDGVLQLFTLFNETFEAFHQFLTIVASAEFRPDSVNRLVDLFQAFLPPFQIIF